MVLIKSRAVSLPPEWYGLLDDVLPDAFELNSSTCYRPGALDFLEAFHKLLLST
jgi:hypothetical protein